MNKTSKQITFDDKWKMMYDLYTSRPMTTDLVYNLFKDCTCDGVTVCDSCQRLIELAKLNTGR